MSLSAWTGRFFRRPRDAPSDAPSPVPRRFGSTAPPVGNAIHALLDGIGLPWRATRRDLTGWHGVRAHPGYDHPAIEVPTPRPFSDGLLWPLSAQVVPTFSPWLPATRFSSATWFGDDARDNLRRTAEQLLPHLGAAIPEERANTVQCRWTSGAAVLRLMIWPPDKQTTRTINAAHARDPRLATACLVEILTGFRPEASAVEQAWLDGFVPVGAIGATRRMGLDPADAENPPENELEYVRAPSGGTDTGRFRGWVGHSADRAALILGRTLPRVVPRAQVMGFRVDRTLPARGPGGARLEVACRTECPGIAAKRLTLAVAEGTEDLNELAAALSGAMGRPFELGTHGLDD